MHYNSSLPRWVSTYLTGLEFILERKRMMLILGLMTILGVTRSALAMCDDIPERVASLCTRLGYKESDCALQYEARKKIGGVLEIAVDDWVSEADVSPLVPGSRATMVRVVTRRAEAIQIYQGADSRNAEQMGLAWAIQQSPCAFLVCVKKRELDPNHQGLTEEQVVDLGTVVNHILFQTGDAEQVADFREAYNSNGIPTITWVDWNNAKVVNRVKSNLASILSVPIQIQFAVPPLTSH